ncbi:DNA polymerase IV [Chromatiaceae bacterium AAb-1]|nr:DNA polymerase IV [Chromatiaceae bacterium AAb-1]
MPRKIIHIDMDCFFAAVEMRDNPALRHIPVAIGGSRAERGVISTCNYPARAFGIRSAMPTAQALKLCPQLTLLSGNMEKYKTASQQIRQIFHRYTEQVEPMSMDEAYLDVTDSILFNGSATRIAEDIRRVIRRETGLTASAGVAPNKFLAKIASEQNKPDGLFVIPPAQVQTFVDALPLQKIPGIGRKTAERLALHGLHTCRDIKHMALPELVKHFGSLADMLLKRSQGIDERQVQLSYQRKSVGVEHTLPQDLQHYPECIDQLELLLPKLQKRLNLSQQQHQIQKIGIKLKFSDFRQTTVEKQHTTLQLDNLLPLLSEAWQRRQQQGVRLVGIQVGFKQSNPEQLAFNFASPT